MRRWIIFLLTGILVFSMTGCYGTGTAVQPESTTIKSSNSMNDIDILDKGPVKGGVIRLFSTKPDTLNPILTKNVYVQDFCSMIFEGLYKLGEDENAEPVLCSSQEVSADGLVWTFHLRQSVKWQDNTPFSAEDVKFTFDQVLNKNTGSIYQKNLENVAIYSAVDASTFRVVLKTPDSDFTSLLTFPILSSRYFAGDDASRANSPKSMQPMGTGPFKMGTSDDPNTISLVANTGWWNIQNTDDMGIQLPYISGIDIKIYPGAADAVNALQTKDIDAAALQVSDFNKYNGRTDLVLRKFTSKNFEYLAFNLTSPIMSQKSVRQAIACTLNKTKLIDDTIPGQAVASDLPIIPGTYMNSMNILSNSPDVKKAKEILLADGWKEDDGVFTKVIQGRITPLKFELLVNDFNDARYSVAQKLAEQLETLGAQVDVKKLPWDQESAAIQSRKFDLVLMGCKITSTPDISFLYSSAGIQTGLNTARYSNPVVDNYLKQLKTETDQMKKKTAMTNLRELIDDEVPYVGLFFYNNAMIYSKRIRGDLDPSAWNRYNDISRWYIPDKK